MNLKELKGFKNQAYLFPQIREQQQSLIVHA
jgi:hypothetical protein